MTDIRKAIARAYCLQADTNPDDVPASDGGALTYGESVAYSIGPVLRAIDAAGYVIAPREPTKEMVEAGRDTCIVNREQAARIYITMVSAHLEVGTYTDSGEF